MKGCRGRLLYGFYSGILSASIRMPAICVGYTGIMTNIGITGHQNIPSQALAYVIRGIRGIITSQQQPVIGYSSLAIGADQLFARLVLENGGSLVAVVPSRSYELTFSAADLPSYRKLLACASKTLVLDYPAPNEQAFMAAGRQVVQSSDLMIAVWDGKPAAGLGGTADVVWDAWAHGKPVVNAWPQGVARD